MKDDIEFSKGLVNIFLRCRDLRTVVVNLSSRHGQHLIGPFLPDLGRVIPPHLKDFLFSFYGADHFERLPLKLLIWRD